MVLRDGDFELRGGKRAVKHRVREDAVSKRRKPRRDYPPDAVAMMRRAYLTNPLEGWCWVVMEQNKKPQKEVDAAAARDKRDG